MAILQRESSLLIREAKLFCFGPELDDIGGGHTRFDRVNCDIEDIAAVFVGIYHCLRGAANGESAVVAGTISIVAVQDVEIGRITWT